MRPGLLLILLSVFSCSVAEPDDVQHRIDIEFAINQKALGNGVVLLESSLTNNGHDLRFLRWNTPFDESVNGHFLQVTETTENGGERELAYQGRMVKRAAPIDSDYLAIAAGSEIENQLDITKSYSFCQNRRYNISLYGDFFDADYRSVQVKVPSAQFETNDSFPICET